MEIRMPQGPDTHDPAVQASAFKLILLLQAAYPYIGSLTNTSHDHPAKLAQASLLQYLDALINPETTLDEAERQAAKENPSIKGTIQLIDYISQLPPETWHHVEDKKSIFGQIKVIASTYPGGRWDESQQQWSINYFYNKDTETDESLMIPPALALNLVCTALFDATRYLTSEDGWVDDLKLRITTVYLHLLGLRQETKKGQTEKCSAGLQHDLLYFLNRSYLDKPQAEGGRPIELLMDAESFLKDCLSTFVEERIHAIHHEVSTTNAMVLAWMQWEIRGSLEDTANPMLIWLRGVLPGTTEDADAGWKLAATQYVTQRCKDFGLNPRSCRIPGYIPALPNIPVVVSHHAILPVVFEIMRMGEILIPQTNLTADSIYHLIYLRNQALIQFKAQLTPDRIELQAKSISNLFSALICVDSLYRYRDLSILIGEEDGRFLRARTQLKTLLLDYFTGHKLDKVIATKHFEMARSAYFITEQDFLSQNNTQFIESFFALMDKEQLTWDAAWARLQALRPDSAAPHPLILSDAALRTWQQQSESISADGATVVDMTPYAINRLLLHGLLVPLREWSPLYSQYLILVTDWLVRPGADSEWQLSQLKKTYSSNLLSNLRFIALVQSLVLDEVLKESLYQLDPSSWVFYSENLFIKLFSLSQEQLNEAQRTQLLTALEGQLGRIIKNEYGLYSLFKLSAEKLNAAQRTQLLIVWEEQLGGMISSSYEFYQFLTLPPEQLNEAQRNQIWRALEGKLGTMISDSSWLYWLFRLSPAQFHEAHRNQLWTAVEGQLGTIIRGIDDLNHLFSIEQFTVAQRSQILTAMENQLPVILNDSYWLCELFTLSPAQLNEAHRNLLWRAVEGKLSTLIYTAGRLFNLFNLSLEKFNEAQRNQIWRALEGQLAKVITNSRELKSLFKLEPEKINAAQRTQILTILEGELGRMIHTDCEQLGNLFELSPEQLNEAQRNQILAALEGQLGLGTIIKHSFRLYMLLKLSPEQLNEAQKNQIWTAVEGQLGTIIKEGSELHQLFELSPAQLNEVQRNQILTALGDQLGLMISGSDYYYLCKLFCLSREQLNEGQRAQIWRAVESKLSTLIYTAGRLFNLFNLSLEKFNEAQRNQIWTAVEGQLGTMIDCMQLSKLFSLSREQLNEVQRAQIWKAMEGQLDTIIKNSGDLYLLFRLSPEQLNTTQRMQIWTVVKNQLGTMQTTNMAFCNLLSLSQEQLNEEQRAQIWRAMQGQLGILIRYRDELINLFKLTPEQFNEAQRNQILAAVQDQLGLQIKSLNDLIKLFKLTSEQLNSAQRTLILTALEEQLGTMIITGFELKLLFEQLSVDELNEAHRAQIWRAVQGQLIRHISELFEIFQLSLAQLNEAQRMQIWGGIEDRLGMMEMSGAVFYNLFNLTPEQLNGAQRTQILNAIKGKLSTMIKNDEELQRFLSLSPEQLNAAQRVHILTVLNKQPNSLGQNPHALFAGQAAAADKPETTDHKDPSAKAQPADDTSQAINQP